MLSIFRDLSKRPHSVALETLHHHKREGHMTLMTTHKREGRAPPGTFPKQPVAYVQLL